MMKRICKKLRPVAGLMLAFSLTACSFAPQYERPEIEMPEAWNKVDLGPNPIAQDWWSRFNDKVLSALIMEALKNNIDLNESLAKIDSAAAQVGQAQSAFFPNVTGTSSAVQNSTSIVGPNMDTASYESTAPGSPSRISSTYQGALSAAWELDLWGKYRNQYTALTDVLTSTRLSHYALRLSIAGQTAQSYFALLAYDMQLDTAKRTLKSREEGLKIYSIRFEQGDITELDLLRSQSEVETARASMLQTIVQRDAAEAALAVLLGRSPRSIMNDKADRGGSIDTLPAPPALPAGLPSDLLLRRPDIRAAEYMIKAYNANIGAARADFFPSISLTGSVGTLSSETIKLFSNPSGMWSYGAQVAMPILDFGRRWYAVDDAEAQKRGSIALYRKTVQNAFKDIRTSLTAQREADAIVGSIQAQVDHLRKASELARLQYDNGYADYLTVLDAERQLFSAELMLASVMRDRLNAVVAVCMALGGGWQDVEPLQKVKKEEEKLETF